MRKHRTSNKALKKQDTNKTEFINGYNVTRVTFSEEAIRQIQTGDFREIKGKKKKD